MKGKVIFVILVIINIIVAMHFLDLNSVALENSEYLNKVMDLKTTEEFLRYFSIDLNGNIEDFGKTKKISDISKKDYKNLELNKTGIFITKPDIPDTNILIDSNGEFPVRGYFRGEKTEEIICSVYNYDGLGIPLKNSEQISAIITKPKDEDLIVDTNWFIPKIKMDSDAARVVITVLGEEGNIYSTSFIAVKNKKVLQSLKVAYMNMYGLNGSMISKYEDFYKDKKIIQNVVDKLREFKDDYPKITQLIKIGESVRGRGIRVLKVGTGPKKIFINATHHPREYIGTVLVMNQIEHLLKMYSEDNSMDGVKVRDLLEDVSFYFLPIVNPDGLQVVVDSNPGMYYNANGVNLNRNYDKSKKTIKSGEKTKTVALAAFSEPETRAIRDFCMKEKFDLSIAYHSAGEIIYWYFGQTGNDKTRDLELANMLKNLTGYELVSPSTVDLKDEKGFKDWIVSKFKKPSFTIEVGRGAVVEPVPLSEYRDILYQNFKIPVALGEKLRKSSDSNYTSKEFNYEKINNVATKFLENNGGFYSIGIKDLKTGYSFIKEDAKMSSASMIKVFIMAEAYNQASKGKISFDEKLRIKNVDKVGGAGLLRYTSGTVQRSIKQLVDLMITKSDNTAANVLIDKLGMNNINALIKRLGCTETKLVQKMMAKGNSSDGKVNTTSVSDLMLFYEKLYRGECVGRLNDSKMITLLKKQGDSSKLSAKLPSGTVVAHKSGELNKVENDGGIIYTPNGDYILCIMTYNIKNNNTVSTAISNVSKEIFDVYKFKY